MKLTVLSLSLALTFAGTAHAGFTVDDRAPQMTALNQQPLQAQTPVVQEISLDVPFVPRHSWINLVGKTALKEHLDEIKDSDQVRITTYAARPQSTSIQKLRGSVLKQWLTANGIASGRITVIDSPETFPDDPSANTATITLIQRKLAPPPAPARAPIPAQPAYELQSHYPQPPARIATVEPSGVINDKVRLTLVQKIVAMAQNKLVKPEDAVTMLAEILKMQEATSVASLPPAVASAVAIDLPRTWTLDHRKTLRENVTEWSKIAKWEVPDWKSSTTFEFSDATLSGTFLDVLEQLSKAVPALDFRADKTYRTLTVADTPKTR